VALAVAILSVTSLLVNTPPARGEPTGGATGTTLRSDELWLDVTVSPARAGLNEMHFTTLSPTGGPKDVLELSVRVSLPGRDVAAIDVPVRRAGPGHYLARGVDFPIPGEWRVEAQALLGATDAEAFAGTIDIR
jgi:copper transport protein